MRELIEGIRVGAVHGPGSRIRPVWFDLNHRQHRIQQVTNSWCERRGESSLLHFHVTDEGALYELIYNLTEGGWQLEQIEVL